MEQMFFAVFARLFSLFRRSFFSSNWSLCEFLLPLRVWTLQCFMIFFLPNSSQSVDLHGDHFLTSVPSQLNCCLNSDLAKPKAISICTVCICMWVYVCITWQGCYWVRLVEIPDSSAAVRLCSLTLTPECTSWLIWSFPSGFDPNEQNQTDTAGTQTQNQFVFCIYVCLL